MMRKNSKNKRDQVSSEESKDEYGFLEQVDIIAPINRATPYLVFLSHTYDKYYEIDILN